jgi:hypothetical protein
VVVVESGSGTRGCGAKRHSAQRRTLLRRALDLLSRALDEEVTASSQKGICVSAFANLPCCFAVPAQGGNMCRTVVQPSATVCEERACVALRAQYGEW